MSARPRDEAVRKSVHVLLSLVAAILVWRLPPIPAATILAAATFAALSIEVLRRTSGAFARLFSRRLGHLLRYHEARRLTGATTLAAGYTLAAVVFPGVPALAGILVAGVADAAAAVIGRRFGRRRYRGGKSIEGSAAFLAVVLPLMLVLPGIPIAAALTLALALTMVESLTLPIDDNLYLPVIAAGAVHLATVLTSLTFFS